MSAIEKAFDKQVERTVANMQATAYQCGGFDPAYASDQQIDELVREALRLPLPLEARIDIAVSGMVGWATHREVVL